MSLPEAEEVADFLLAGGGTNVLDEDCCRHVECLICGCDESVAWYCIVLCCDVYEGEETRREKGRQGGGICLTGDSWHRHRAATIKLIFWNMLMTTVYRMRGTTFRSHSIISIKQCLSQTVARPCRRGLQASPRIWTRPASYSSHQRRKAREMSKRIDSKIAYLASIITVCTH